MSTYKKLITKNFLELQDLINNFSDDQINLITEIASIIMDTINKGGCIFWCGNGGSASDCQHLSAELMGRYERNRIPYKSLSLNSDTAVITCVANDFGYENLFARQLYALGKKDDLIIVLSTSGNSENINRVLDQAKKKEIKSISLLGKGGGLIKNKADYSLIINSNNTARIQEMHTLVGHIICEIIDKELCL